MIPPEPDPPEPTIPEYTYATATQFSLGAVTATYYSDIQLGDTACKLPYTYGPSSHPMSRDLVDLVLYDDVVGDHQCYFADGDASYFYGVLGSNSAIGTTVPVYSVNNGEALVAHDGYILNSTPSDYYTNVINRNFTLTQRS